MNEWERQYHDSIAAENAALGVASLEYEPTLMDLQSYLWALTFPAALLGVAFGWVSEQFGVGRWPGTILGGLVWFVSLTVMVCRWGKVRSMHRKAQQHSGWRPRTHRA